MSGPTMHPVESSNIDRIGHDGSALHVAFKSGGTHRYENVPAETFEAMRAAESVGKFFHAHIRSKHTSSKVGG